MAICNFKYWRQKKFLGDAPFFKRYHNKKIQKIPHQKHVPPQVQQLLYFFNKYSPQLIFARKCKLLDTVIACFPFFPFLAIIDVRYQLRWNSQSLSAILPLTASIGTCCALHNGQVISCSTFLHWQNQPFSLKNLREKCEKHQNPKNYLPKVHFC